MIVLAAVLASTSAQTSAGEKAWIACIDRTTANTEWAECGGTYIRWADVALNAEWKRLLAVAQNRNRTDLIAEERVWVAYREKACRFYANGEQGREGQVEHYQNCLAHMIERRTAELAQYRRDLIGPP